MTVKHHNEIVSQFFQEKRGDREVENLFAILEKFAEIKDVELVTVKKCGVVGLPVLKEKLDQAIQLFDEVETDYLETRKVYTQSMKHDLILMLYFIYYF